MTEKGEGEAPERVEPDIWFRWRDVDGEPLLDKEGFATLFNHITGRHISARNVLRRTYPSRGSAENLYPRPIHVGRAVAWRYDVVRAFAEENLTAARTKERRKAWRAQQREERRLNAPRARYWAARIARAQRFVQPADGFTLAEAADVMDVRRESFHSMKSRKSYPAGDLDPVWGQERWSKKILLATIEAMRDEELRRRKS